MNKLTEIKRSVEIAGNVTLANYMHKSADELNADSAIRSNAKEWLSYLISFLEEKDKALAFYADNDNWENGHAKYNDEGDKVGIESYVEEDGGDIARKALGNQP